MEQQLAVEKGKLDAERKKMQVALEEKVKISFSSECFIVKETGRELRKKMNEFKDFGGILFHCFDKTQKDRRTT